MSVLVPSRALFRASRSFLRPNGPQLAVYCIRRRTFADVASDDISLPLKGYKVLDMTRVLAGVEIPSKFTITFADRYSIAILHANPWRSRVRSHPTFHRTVHELTSLSAEVIKIEHPTRGDDTRAWGPPYAKYIEGSGKEGAGESAYFLAVDSRDPQGPHELTPTRSTEIRSLWGCHSNTNLASTSFTDWLQRVISW